MNTHIVIHYLQQMNIKQLCVCFFCNLMISITTAQIDNKMLTRSISVLPDDSNSYGFEVHNLNYLRNTEYFNPIELGQTLFGYQLQPSVFIQSHPRIKIRGGIWFRHDFGNNNPFTQVLPIFTFSYNTGKGQIHFGTIEGAMSHRMIEPLFNINHVIERPVENGFQFLHASERLFFDTWINWERFIERGVKFKEQFTAGLNFTPRLIDAKCFQFKPSIQAIAFHRGGQIDTDTGKVVMIFNTAAGMVLIKNWNHKWIKKSSLDFYVVNYIENGKTGYFPYDMGDGIFSNFTHQIAGVDFILSYWQGNSFLAPRGTYLYQSSSIDNIGYTEKNRTLLFTRLVYNKQITDNLKLSARFEPVLDVNRQKWDMAFSVYFSYLFVKKYALN